MNHDTQQHPAPPPVEQAVLEEIERVAVELAHVAGAEITSALNRTFLIKYKKEAGEGAAPTDPVSEVDHNVEVFIRGRLAERFPDHEIIGEEVDVHPQGSPEFIWVIDPVDGTTNFINTFPLFAASIGVLHQGYPVAGAIWCSASHELRPGVYHAHRGGQLRFDGHPVEVKGWKSAIRRRLVGSPGGTAGRDAGLDTRVTGSAAIECAFVAAGILSGAYFNRPWIWDVAAGPVLLQAAGREIWTKENGQWRPLQRFVAPATAGQRPPTLRDWNQSLLLGSREAIEALRPPAG
ncbi:MAG: inositol monophosphatase [Pseudomonadota bacterium]|nr:inositol monophosphatase [Pseudomonadota bacterium]